MAIHHDEMDGRGELGHWQIDDAMLRPTDLSASVTWQSGWSDYSSKTKITKGAGGIVSMTLWGEKAAGNIANDDICCVLPSRALPAGDVRIPMLLQDWTLGYIWLYQVTGTVHLRVTDATKDFFCAHACYVAASPGSF